MDGLCPGSALQHINSRGTGSTLGEHLSMAWPAQPRAGSLFSSHSKVTDSVYRQRDDSLGGQQCILNTAMHMAAASRARPGQYQPGMDPLAPPALEPEQAALSVYVDTRRDAVDPLAPPARSDSKHEGTLPLAQSQADAADQRTKGFTGRSCFAGTAIATADTSSLMVPDADVERVSFEIIEDEATVQHLISHGSGECSGGGSVAEEGGSSGAGLCTTGQRICDHMRGGGGGAAKNSPQACSSKVGEQDRAAEYASCPGSCAPPERSESVGVQDEGLPPCPRSPGGSAQVSAARAGAGIATAGQEVQSGARAWPNVRALAAKVRQRVDSETADIVRKCAVGASHSSA